MFRTTPIFGMSRDHNRKRLKTRVVYHLLGKTGWSTVVGRVKTRLEISPGMHLFQLQDCSLGAEGDKRIKPPEISLLIFIVVVRF